MFIDVGLCKGETKKVHGRKRNESTCHWHKNNLNIGTLVRYLDPYRTVDENGHLYTRSMGSNHPDEKHFPLLLSPINDSLR